MHHAELSKGFSLAEGTAVKGQSYDDCLSGPTMITHTDPP